MPDGYRLFVSQDELTLVRIFDSGVAEVVTREDVYGIWGPPMALAEEGAAPDREALLEAALTGPDVLDNRWSWLLAGAEALEDFSHHDDCEDPHAVLECAGELTAIYDAVRPLLAPKLEAAVSSDERKTDG